MAVLKVLTIIVLAVSFGIQAINLAAQGLAAKTYYDGDALAGTTDKDSNWGYFTFVLCASALSCLLYIYLLIVKIVDKTPSAIVDCIIWHITVVLQFAIACVLAVNLTNISTGYNLAISTLDSLQALGTTGPLIDVMVHYKQSHQLSTAALILDYIVSFGCSFILMMANLKTHLDSAELSPERIKEHPSSANIAQ